MPTKTRDSKPSKWGINLNATNCPKCGQRMPAIRLPKNLEQMMWGGWTCPKCGCQVDRWGNAVERKK